MAASWLPMYHEEVPFQATPFIMPCIGNKAFMSSSTLVSSDLLTTEISLIKRFFAVSIIFLSPKERSLSSFRIHRSRSTLATS